MEINFDTWSRRKEVIKYAEIHHITIEQAIERLVNSGLSYEPVPYIWDNNNAAENFSISDQ